MSSTFTIMSFNLRCSTSNDGKNSWPYRKEYLVEVINKYSPNLLGTQECILDQAEYISANIKGYFFYGVGRDKDGTGEMSGLYYNNKLFSAIKTGTFWLSETPDIPGSKPYDIENVRIASWMKIHHLPSGNFFYWYNTHLDHTSENARILGAKVILETINKNDDLPIIISGDFNTVENSKTWNIFYKAGFKDSAHITEKSTGPEYTFHNFVGPNVKIRERIDWILTRGFSKVNYLETITDNQNDKYPSDHLPIITEVTF